MTASNNITTGADVSTTANIQTEGNVRKYHLPKLNLKNTSPVKQFRDPSFRLKNLSRREVSLPGASPPRSKREEKKETLLKAVNTPREVLYFQYDGAKPIESAKRRPRIDSNSIGIFFND